MAVLMAALRVSHSRSWNNVRFLRRRGLSEYSKEGMKFEKKGVGDFQETTRFNLLLLINSADSLMEDSVQLK